MKISILLLSLAGLLAVSTTVFPMRRAFQKPMLTPHNISVLRINAFKDNKNYHQWQGYSPEVLRQFRLEQQEHPEFSFDNKHYNAVKKTQEFFYGLLKEARENGEIADTRILFQSFPIFYKNQTQKGLFLEYKDSYPSALWTPWGKLPLLDNPKGKNNWDNLNQELLKQLGAELHREKREEHFYGLIGPIYKIKRINDAVLPNPLEREKDRHVSTELAQANWNILESRYNQLLEARIKKEIARENEDYARVLAKEFARYQDIQ